MPIKNWYFIFSSSPRLCIPLSVSLSLSVSLHSPDTLEMGCETSSDVSTGIQRLIPDQEAPEENSESTEAGCVLSCPTDPGPERHQCQSGPSQNIQGELPDLECTTQG